ncbi:DUF6882 domain-containing protein [Rothia kristinae]|uniref:DUF6882 domain-containing protein n=1 Tax=Rothia kristinae TaxID=37923 RepID=UPI0021A3F0D0|nr:DUF6882 domain-containing protein [Rothia kristinae]MCT1357149.1 hydrolase [Rothia kristinae]MCT1393471.1 hydrolase [Rothia kristinae]MCT1506419.1 hydrolase [Rothia kristinae]MCT2039046.1 hydrolase [Rothia kristinae]MCT2244217.1 hydrolase [Rothia kristinae]
MTKTLQDLIDEALFISTEHQARLAELTGDSDWDVDFSAPSFTLQADPSVSLTPSLLGTESEQRGSWIWSWQELGHFPDAVVAAAVQAREAGESLGVQELATDELILSEGLARRLTLAAKAVTGIYAHYPATAGGGVRAWLLLDGPQFELPEPTVQRMGRVMAQALQTGTAVHHQRAVDSYARLRGAHITWDTEACAIITAVDGALRLWFDDQKITGIEAAEPVVDSRELARCARAAAERRQRLREESREALRLAAAEGERQRRAREQEEAERVARTQAALAEQRDERAVAAAADRAAEEEPLPERMEELSPQTAATAGTESAQPEGVRRAETGGDGAPFDHSPRADAEPGLVASSPVDADEAQPRTDQYTQVPAAEQEPAEAPARRQEERQPRWEAEEATGRHEVVQEYAEYGEDAEERTEAPQREAEQEPEENLTALERLRRANAQAGPQEPGRTRREERAEQEPEYVVEDQQEEQQPKKGKKKGFFSRFLGL